MGPGEWILLRLSRDPGAADLTTAEESLTEATELAFLRSEFPDFDDMVRGRRVADFGCGAGRQAMAMSRAGAEWVLGLDINERLLEAARESAAARGLGPDRVAFAPEPPPGTEGTFDVVLSKDSFEHFSDPEEILARMKRLLAPGGSILVTFGPPWFAPYGSHTHFFTRVPWVNLLFREKTVMRVRSRYRSDGAARYEDVESGLNRMTVARFERIVGGSGLAVERLRLTAVKGLPLVSRLPVLRELLVNNVSCVLRRRR